MTNMAKKTEVPHDWATWPQGVKQIIPFPGFLGGKQPKPKEHNIKLI